MLYAVMSHHTLPSSVHQVHEQHTVQYYNAAFILLREREAKKRKKESEVETVKTKKKDNK